MFCPPRILRSDVLLLIYINYLIVMRKTYMQKEDERKSPNNLRVIDADHDDWWLVLLIEFIHKRMMVLQSKKKWFFNRWMCIRVSVDEKLLLEIRDNIENVFKVSFHSKSNLSSNVFRRACPLMPNFSFFFSYFLVMMILDLVKTNNRSLLMCFPSFSSSFFPFFSFHSLFISPQFVSPSGRARSHFVSFPFEKKKKIERQIASSYRWLSSSSVLCFSFFFYSSLLSRSFSFWKSMLA